jgi:UDP-2,3-diacylglucosamine pyrophosphatase LpxH
MHIAIISDVHLGDADCRMLHRGRLTATFTAFRDTVRGVTGGEPLDFLVLDGDILDFSINSFHESLRLARPFFRALEADALTRRIVYVPGNHDKHVWDVVEWQTNVVLELAAHEEAKPFRRAQSGLIDTSLAGARALTLPGVKRGRDGEYGSKLFLRGLFDKKKTLPIAVAYPNLFIKTPRDTVLVTHGHMLEAAWVLLSELMEGLVGDDPGIEELEEWNIPLTSLICTGVGQAGAVSKLFYEIQQEAKAEKSRRLKDVLDHIGPRLDERIDLPWYLESLDNALLAGVRRVAPRMAEKADSARYDKRFFEKETVRKRFRRFFRASAEQAGDMHRLEKPSRIVFGHTHEPITERRPIRAEVDGHPVSLVNCGGWLRKGKRAAVFFVDGQGDLSSVKLK